MFEIVDHGPVPDLARGAVLAVGNFDGVHRGHAELVRRLRIAARAAGVPALVLTFDPHPAALLKPEAAPAPLTWLDRTATLLKAAGADEVGVFRTGRWLLELSSREFYDRIVRGQFEARGMVEGLNFRFGHDRTGNVEQLGHWCREAGLGFKVVEPLEWTGEPVSSSRIRAAVSDGRMSDAAAMLGRPHRIRGMVARGAGRGAGLGFPTANLQAIDVLIPPDGVYAGRTHVDASEPPWPTALHIGPNATFGERSRTVEAHLIGFQGDLYGRRLEVDLLQRLRGSRKFESVPALLEQMRRDVLEASRVAARAGCEGARPT